MQIQTPEDVTVRYYAVTLKLNPDIILEGFHNDPKNEEYIKSREYLKNREDLKNAFELTYLCDYWLDKYCHQHPKIRHSVPVSTIIKHIQKYFGKDIPLGCLLIAIMHREEMYYISPNNQDIQLLIQKKAYDEYVFINGDVK